MFFSKKRNSIAVVSRPSQPHVSQSNTEYILNHLGGKPVGIIAQIEHAADIKELRLFGIKVWSSIKTQTTTTR